ncbi:DUF4201 domain-containing protein [Plasmodiophora brassicae]|uniref:Uncharacterized protein n=1 Tax=Plasmodiophora brassicae TaxID=37360 RepID=A0A3P3Y816_PLABS|nr:unnamed protein product [Plasmodiophora brassicae]
MDRDKLEALLRKAPKRRPPRKKTNIHELPEAKPLPLLRSESDVLDLQKKASDNRSMLATIRSLKQKLQRADRANRQLKGQSRFVESKLASKDAQIDEMLQRDADPVGLRSQLLNHKSLARRYREQIRAMKEEADETASQLEDLRQQCKFSQLEELRAKVDEFYAEVVRLRALRDNDVTYIVRVAKTLEGDLRDKLKCKATSLKKQVGELRASGRPVPDDLLAILAGIAEERSRLLHVADATTLADRTKTAKRFRKARALIDRLLAPNKPDEQLRFELDQERDVRIYRRQRRQEDRDARRATPSKRASSSSRKLKTPPT